MRIKSVGFMVGLAWVGLALSPAADGGGLTTQSSDVVARQPGDLMDLLVIDWDTRQPIPAADIYSFGLPDRFVGVTNNEGHVQLPIPFSKFRYFIIAVRPKGWAFKRMVWEGNSKPEDVPDNYTMEMKRSVKVRGTVVDEKGEGIGNAGVVIAFHKKLDKPFEQLDTAGHGGTTSIKTNGKGSFTYTAAPPDCESIDVTVIDNRYARNSPDASDRAVPAAKLYDGSAVFAVKKGVALRGTVTDVQGKPIVGATITSGEWTNQVPPPATSTGEDGKFSLALRLGESTEIKVEAKGFVSETKEEMMTGDKEVAVTLQAVGQ